MARYTIEDGINTNKFKLRFIVAALILLGAALAVLSVYKPAQQITTVNQEVQALAPTITPPVAVKIQDPLPWPNYGQAAYGVTEKGVLASSDSAAKPVPVASLAKVITALAILEKKPLKPGEQGPLITLGPQDIASYEEYVSKSGAVVPVEVGEQITQYQAMQAMLMPSANNMADTLARWAFGSIDAYNVYANTMVNKLELTNTVVSDASGFSPQTTSTAAEMVKLGVLYMENPVLIEIAMQTDASIPFAGRITNYNAPVNKDGIVGLKVGDTDEAGRCFLVADVRLVNNSAKVTSITAVLGADDLSQAMQDSLKILKEGNKAYDKLTKANSQTAQ